MSDPKQVKVQLFDAAVKLVAPIVAAAAAKVQFAVDPTVQESQLRALNLFAFEEVQVAYNGLRLAFENNDPTAWPDPTVASAGASTVASTPSTPVPSPGANLSGVAQVAGTIASVANAVNAAAS